jgi:CheY-like chemotaxis protein
MHRVLVVDGDEELRVTYESILRGSGYVSCGVCCGLEALKVAQRAKVDLVLSDLHLRDMSGADLLRNMRRTLVSASFVMSAASVSTIEIAAAIRLGASEVLGRPIAAKDLVTTVAAVLSVEDRSRDSGPPSEARDYEAHAATRWSQALVPLVDSPKDPRTLKEWSQVVFVSPGALRNWCRTAGIPARRSLVFARLLRAAYLNRSGDRKPADVLNVADRRTLVGLLRMAGLDASLPYPCRLPEFIDRQQLVRDRHALRAIKGAIEGCQRLRHAGAPIAPRR